MYSTAERFFISDPSGHYPILRRVESRLWHGRINEWTVHLLAPARWRCASTCMPA